MEYVLKNFPNVYDPDVIKTPSGNETVLTGIKNSCPRPSTIHTLRPLIFAFLTRDL